MAGWPWRIRMIRMAAIFPAATIVSAPIAKSADNAEVAVCALIRALYDCNARDEPGSHHRSGLAHMEHGDLKGKSAIVTGSATGIGASVAIGLARRGANVVVNYTKSEKEAREVVKAVKAAGAEARLVQGNVAEDADCKKLAAAALDAWGSVHILVNNAGTTKFAAHNDLDALSADDFHNIYGVNVIGAFQMIRAVA